ncbi:hypothetical protein IMG5_167340 [Ichthyophthirius multifiliis]|uniref:Uncharacterized protein n=1 Tax=Ichthyophthirius multifiliis TaxID=5932 RepID=G0R0X0_ICHMU|nr:hypothetical protein IMG5_167340 [Ichthyophthirius multifiliis]EGR28881.1 hypothetical protein IMG5_167340 [Ichthyophthirius multifiliis]|eukprot:XP_004030117.1 hypothetical protein IMG5_167340 [Ichthyophthirius multifiliis]
MNLQGLKKKRVKKIQKNNKNMFQKDAFEAVQLLKAFSFNNTKSHNYKEQFFLQYLKPIIVNNFKQVKNFNFNLFDLFTGNKIISFKYNQKKQVYSIIKYLTKKYGNKFQKQFLIGKDKLNQKEQQLYTRFYKIYKKTNYQSKMYLNIQVLLDINQKTNQILNGFIIQKNKESILMMK